MALIQQTVDSLENEFNTKMGQIRLLLQHLKGSIQPSTDTCTDIQSSSTRPQHFPSETVRHTGKRSNASGTSTPISTKRARKT